MFGLAGLPLGESERNGPEWPEIENQNRESEELSGPRPRDVPRAPAQPDALPCLPLRLTRIASKFFTSFTSHPRCHTTDPLPLYRQVSLLFMPQSFQLKTRALPRPHQLMPQLHPLSKIPSVHVAHVIHGPSHVWTMSPLGRNTTIHRID